MAGWEKSRTRGDRIDPVTTTGRLLTARDDGAGAAA